MKIIRKIINWKQSLFQLQCVIEENTDDCWNIYNLINRGDYIFAKMKRKVHKETLAGVFKAEKRTISTLIRIKKWEY